MLHRVKMLFFYLAGLAIFALLGLNVYAAFEPSPVWYPETVFSTDKKEYQIGEDIKYHFTVCVRYRIKYEVEAKLINLDENIPYPLPTFERTWEKGCHTQDASPKFIPSGILVPGNYKIAFEAHPSGIFRKDFAIPTETDLFFINANAESQKLFPFIRLKQSSVAPVIVSPTPEPTPIVKGSVQSQPQATGSPRIDATPNPEAKSTPAPAPAPTPVTEATPQPTPTPVSEGKVCVIGICLLHTLN